MCSKCSSDYFEEKGKFMCVLTRCCFSIFLCSSGFWAVKLYEQSSDSETSIDDYVQVAACMDDYTVFNDDAVRE